jgi:uncharacterized tellurite resistance protein B-like protein
MNTLIMKVLGIGGDGRPVEGESSLTRTNLAASLLLLDAACANPDFTVQDRGHLVGTMLSTLALPADHIEKLIEMSSESIDVSLFKDQLNNNFNSTERMAILEAAWKVVYSEDQMSRHEEHFVRRFNSILWLSDQDMSEARRRAKKEK